jgi:hypothetical protein
MRKPVHHAGFTAPSDRALGDERRSVAFAELIATVGLMLCTIVAAIVITTGIARADVGSGIIDSDGTVFVVALLLGLCLIGIGGLTGFTFPSRHRRHRH